MPILVLVGETAALGEYNFRLRPDPFLNALQNCYAMRRTATISAKMQPVGIRPNYRDGFQFAQIEGQQVFVILE